MGEGQSWQFLFCKESGESATMFVQIIKICIAMYIVDDAFQKFSFSKKTHKVVLHMGWPLHQKPMQWRMAEPIQAEFRKEVISQEE